jgi:hypothetical protein
MKQIAVDINGAVQTWCLSRQIRYRLKEVIEKAGNLAVDNVDLNYFNRNFNLPAMSAIRKKYIFLLLGKQPAAFLSKTNER